MRLRIGFGFLLATVASIAPALEGSANPVRAILKVGKGRSYATVRQAAAAAKDGDVIEIDAGTYSRDVAVWRANNLTIRGVGKGRAHMKADGASADGKGIWVMYARNVTVENIEFSGASVRDRNGAGIRFQGSGLTVRNCYFHDNEDGLLAGDAPDGDILIERSEFDRNGYGDGQSHNLYIGKTRNFTIRFSRIHRAKIGHNVKSRALTNTIAYNHISDDAEGTASYAVDLSNGGQSFVVGNLIHKGRLAENATLLAYALEGGRNPVQELYVVNNTFVTERNPSTFISYRGTPVVRVINNIFRGPGRISANQVEAKNNLTGVDPLFRDPARGDYRLQKGSPAVDAGIDPGAVGRVKLVPQFHFSGEREERRPRVGAVDIGAFEYTPEAAGMRRR